jgi:hypothetical protein
LFEKVINFIVLQRGYHRRILQQADSENVFTAGSYGETAMMRSTSLPPVSKMKRR